jgi:hypothetical protein
MIILESWGIGYQQHIKDYFATNSKVPTVFKVHFLLYQYFLKFFEKLDYFFNHD